MTKKQYTIIGITILIFIILIAFILIKGNKSSWTKEILNSNSYTITKIDCDNNKTKLDNNIMKKIDFKVLEKITLSWDPLMKK